MDIPEIQSLDIEEIAVQKAKDYYLQLRVPIIIEDHGLMFSALGEKLPGAYIKDFLKAVGNEGLIKLLRDDENRAAVAETVIAYCDNPDNVRVFKGEVRGTITNKARGDKGFGWDPIFIPDGESRTFGEMEMEEKNKYSMRRIALEKFKDWLDENT